MSEEQEDINKIFELVKQINELTEKVSQSGWWVYVAYRDSDGKVGDTLNVFATKMVV